MKCIVFAHNKRSNGNFCTDVGGRNAKTGAVMQMRLRLKPNEPLRYSCFGAQSEDFRTQLRPGSVLELGRVFIPLRFRATHPEDYTINPDEVTLVQGEDWSAKLLEYAEEIAYGNVHKLFPGLQRSNGTYYRPGRANNSRSVGYIRADSVRYIDDSGELCASLLDKAGNEFTVPVDGVTLLEDHPPLEKSLVRLSLAGGLKKERWAGTDHPERCSLLLSHVIKL